MTTANECGGSAKVKAPLVVCTSSGVGAMAFGRAGVFTVSNNVGANKT